MNYCISQSALKTFLRLLNPSVSACNSLKRDSTSYDSSLPLCFVGVAKPHWSRRVMITSFETLFSKMRSLVLWKSIATRPDVRFPSSLLPS